MSKSLFAVVLTDGQEAGATRLREVYSNAQVYELENNVFLVSGDMLRNTVATSAALTKEQEDEGIRGVVFKLNGSYTGYTRASLWEWLENVEGAE